MINALFLKTAVSWTDSAHWHRFHFQGEWVELNCTIRSSENVTLWFGKGNDRKQLQVDNDKIVLVSKNVFNVTRLTNEDDGWYVCKVCGKKKEIRLEISRNGKLSLIIISMQSGNISTVYFKLGAELKTCF